MTDMLKTVLESEFLNEEIKKSILDEFTSIIEAAKTEQEKALRKEFAERYESDKEKIAEAVEQFVAQRMESEITEFHSDMKGLAEQRLKFVNAQAALKENARAAVAKRMAVFEKALQRALVKETRELHEDLKINRRAAALAIGEAKAQAEADRQAFRVKGAKIIEHIIEVKLANQMRALSEDIEKAKQNDFGARIFEAFIAEARRSFFNSNKEMRGIMGRMQQMQEAFAAEKAQLIDALNEAKDTARAAVSENRQIKENAQRFRIQNRLLQTVPAGEAREKMKTLLEAAPVAKIEQTFKKFASTILSETRKQPTQKSELTELAIGMRNGNGRITEVEDADDEEILNLRRLTFGSNVVGNRR